MNSLEVVGLYYETKMFLVELEYVGCIGKLFSEGKVLNNMSYTGKHSVVSQKYSRSFFYNKENDKDLNYVSDLYSQFHIIKDEEIDYKNNSKLKHGYPSNSGDMCETNYICSSGYNYNMLKRNKWKSKCPCCFGNSKVYHCAECLKGGNFYHSSGKNPERYADKKLKEQQYRRQLSTLREKFDNEEPQWAKQVRLKNEIERLRERNALLKKNIGYGRLQLKNIKVREKTVQHQIHSLVRTLPRFSAKNADLNENVERYTERIRTKEEIISSYRKDIQENANSQIKQVVNEFFPFAKIEPEVSCESDENDKMVKDLAEATQTEYVHGRWVTERLLKQSNKYSILSSILPENGDLAGFIRREDRSKMKEGKMKSKEVEKQEEEEREIRRVKNVCAGLCFLAQITRIIAYYLNVHLPKDVSLSDFSCSRIEELEDRKFQKLMSRLNANVFYLCLAQGVPPSSLHPFRALPNMMALLTEKNELGRLGYFEIPETIHRCLDEIEQSDLFPDSDSDSEWETVNACTMQDISEVTSFHRPPSFEDRSGIVTSVLSMFGMGNRS